MLPEGTSPLRRRWTVVGGLATLALVSFLLVPSPAAASADSRLDGRAWADRPERGIAGYTEYSRLTVPVGETVRMDLTVENRGRRNENVLVKLAQVPEGWQGAIRGGQFAGTGVPVTPWTPRVLSFTAEPRNRFGPEPTGSSSWRFSFGVLSATSTAGRGHRAARRRRG